MAGEETPNLFQNVPEYSVAALANNIKKTLEQSFGHIRLRGEISGYRGPHSSGHCYFALKDEKARIDAVVWRGVFGKLKFKPEEGMEVIATGKVSSYPGSSKYQIVIEALEPAGVGALMALLEERKKKLAAEGLFDEECKKPIPFLPRVIGIVTSPTGAVIRDMMHGFTERFPAHVVVWPARVQGETCAAEVAHAIKGFNAMTEDSSVPRPDLLIVARGGGSLEDLWGFNEEIVARAAAESEIPLISAVGHETDWTIIDLVADARAPTPTKAAEWAVPKYSELLDRLAELGLRLHRTTRRFLEERRSHLTGLSRALPKPTDLVAMPRQRLDSASSRLTPALRMQAQKSRGKWGEFSNRLGPALQANIHVRKTAFIKLSGRFTPVLSRATQSKRLAFQRVSSRIHPQNLYHKIQQGKQVYENLGQRAQRAVIYKTAALKEKLEGTSKLLNSLGYQNVLKRGFSLVRDDQGHMLRSTKSVSAGQMIDIELADGHIEAAAQKIATDPKKGDTVDQVQKGMPTGKKETKPTKPTSKSDASDQGSLF